MPKKLQAFKEFKLPTSQKDVLHFCGALNYFRTSLNGLKTPEGFKSAAAILQPLYAVGTDKLPLKTKFQDVWNNSASLKKSFEQAKQMLINAVELHHPHPEYPLALFADASDLSIGGSLQMLAPDGSFKPLGFYSSHLTETQRKYSVFKKELLGAFKSLRHFLPEVYGRHVRIYVDHLPLVQAFKNNNLPLNDPQTYRQITEIGRFTRDVKHVSGVDNVFANFLSRIKEENKGTAYLGDAAEIAAAEEMQFQLTSLETIKDLQGEDPEISRIRSGDKPRSAVFGDKTVT